MQSAIVLRVIMTSNFGMTSLAFWQRCLIYIIYFLGWSLPAISMSRISGYKTLNLRDSIFEKLVYCSVIILSPVLFVYQKMPPVDLDKTSPITKIELLANLIEILPFQQKILLHNTYIYIIYNRLYAAPCMFHYMHIMYVRTNDII